MILVDTGPLVALFNRRDPHHRRCQKALRGFREALTTTTPVLTETFHMLSAGSLGGRNVRAFVTAGGLSTWFMDHALDRAFELMDQYESAGGIDPRASRSSADAPSILETLIKVEPSRSLR